MIFGAARPLALVGYVLLGLALLAVISGIVWFIRAGRDELGRRRGTLPVALIALGVGLAAFGSLALFLKPGATASPAALPEFSEAPPLTTTLSPVPTAPNAPQVITETEQSAEPVQIGFEVIGSLDLGAAKARVEQEFGKSAAIVETTGPDGKPANAYTYEGKNRNFMIYVQKDKVSAYSVESPGFVTLSGVAVGDDFDKLKKAYGSKLRSAANNEYVLDGPRGTSVSFQIENAKIVRIRGGQL